MNLKENMANMSPQSLTEAKFLNILWGLELILRIELGTESPMVQNF